MKEFDLFPAEDTLIKCNLPDGNHIEIDALEVQWLLQEAWVGKEPSSTTIYTIRRTMIDKFQELFGFRMSMNSMNMLLDIKDEILFNAKKNTSPSSAPSDSTEQPQPLEPDAS